MEQQVTSGESALQEQAGTSGENQEHQVELQEQVQLQVLPGTSGAVLHGTAGTSGASATSGTAGTSGEVSGTSRYCRYFR